MEETEVQNLKSKVDFLENKKGKPKTLESRRKFRNKNYEKTNNNFEHFSYFNSINIM